MSENGYFDDLEDSSDPLEAGKFTELESDKDALTENFDAFNEETFDCALEGDWEAEHDKLLELEQNDLNSTLTKYENADDDEENDFKQDDDEFMNGYNQQSNSNIRLDPNTIKQINSKNNFMANQSNSNNNVINNNNNNSAKLSNQQDNNNANLIEEQLKLFTQLQLQQQQLKNQQILQQAQKQYQQQQINSMLLASMNARNNQMRQMQQNLMQKQQQQQQQQQQHQPQHQFNIMQNNSTASNVLTNEPNRKTPINFNLNMMSQQLNDKENNMQSYLNLVNQAQFKNNTPSENDSIKLKNLLEKINQMNINSNINSNNIAANNNTNRPMMPVHSLSSDQLNNRRESPVLKQSGTEQPATSIIHSILHSQPSQSSGSSTLPFLPKLPPTKVKTLEEIENELLNQSQSGSNATKSPLGQNYSRHSPSDIHQQEFKNNQIRLQQHQQQQQQMSNQQQPDVSKFFPLMNNAKNNNATNTSSNSPNVHSPNDNIEKQKKILEALAIHQYQQQILKMQQQQQQQQQQINPLLNQAQPNSLLNQPLNNNANSIEQQIQQQLIMIQQQLIPVQLNLNAMLPPNFPTLSTQQKQLILNQIQRNLQATLLQQQLLQQQQQNGQMQRLEDQLKLNNNNNNNYNNDLNNNNNGRNNNNINRQQQQNNQNRNDNKDRKKQPQNNMRNSNSNNNSFNNGNNTNNLNNTSGDKLAGMMTDKEKNWVVNVQMLQLQIDDPYRYDYYYTAWMLKKKQFSMKNTNSAGLKTSALQLINNKDPKNYRPLTFENSLGKVTMSNFHHPRALIDLNRDSEHTDPSIVTHIDGLDEDDEKQKEVKNKDTILLEIEKIYQVLLSIDEIEHSILKAPEEMRNHLFHERRGKVDKLALMLCTENFPHYLFVEKGKRLIAKAIPIFNLAQAKLILGFFMQYIYIISKNNIALDEVYSHIGYAIDMQKFTDLVEIVNQFVHLYSRQPVSVFHTIFTNKFSLTFLLKFMSKSDLVNQDDYDNDIKTIWSCYLNLILAGLSLIQPLSVNADGTNWNISETNSLNVKAVLDNFSVDADLWSKNEIKLKELFALI